MIQNLYYICRILTYGILNAKKVKEKIYILFGLTILISALLYIFYSHYSAYGMFIGSIGFLIMFLSNPYRGENVRVRRLYLFQIFATILLIVTSYMMYSENSQWIIFLLISCVFFMYSVFNIPESRK